MFTNPISMAFNIFSPWWWFTFLYWAGAISVLLLNAVCILDVDRFLGRIDLAVPREYPQTTVDKMINMGINMANTFRRPTRAMLIPLNIIFIVLKLLW